MCDKIQWSILPILDQVRPGLTLMTHRVTHDEAGLVDLDAELCRIGPRLPMALERSEGLLVEHLRSAGYVVFPS